MSESPKQKNEALGATSNKALNLMNFVKMISEKKNSPVVGRAEVRMNLGALLSQLKQKK